MYECKCSCHSVCIKEGSALLEMCVLPYKFLLDKTVMAFSMCSVFSFSKRKFFQNCQILSFLCAGHPGLPL